MASGYYDLCLKTSEPAALARAAELGWNGVCVAHELQEARKLGGRLKAPGNIECYLGALVSGDVEKNARKALEFADIVLVEGGLDEVNRAASECWEVDVLLHPERGRERDFMDYRNSGFDQVMASFMAERGIALGIDFSTLLSSQGRSLQQTLGRIRQNVKVALKHKVPVVLASGAGDPLGLRSPLDLSHVSGMLGVPEHLARKIVSAYPSLVVAKMRDRKNPDVILKGLGVVDWGGQKPSQPKRAYGWY